MNREGKQGGNEDQRATKEESPGHICAHFKAQHEFSPGAAKGDKSVYRGYNDEKFAKLYMAVDFIPEYEEDPAKCVLSIYRC